MKITYLGKKHGKFIVLKSEEFNFKKLSHDSEQRQGYDRLLYDRLNIIIDQYRLYAFYLYTFTDVEMEIEFGEDYTKELHLHYTIIKIRRDLNIY